MIAACPAILRLGRAAWTEHSGYRACISRKSKWGEHMLGRGSRLIACISFLSVQCAGKYIRRRRDEIHNASNLRIWFSIAVLLASQGASHAQTPWPYGLNAPTMQANITPEAGEVSQPFISNVKVTQDDQKRWIVSLDVGRPDDPNWLLPELQIGWANQSEVESPLSRGVSLHIAGGRSHVVAELVRPFGDPAPKATTWLVAVLRSRYRSENSMGNRVVATQSVPIHIEWPAEAVYAKDYFVNVGAINDILRYVSRATTVNIDGPRSEPTYRDIKMLLERFLLKYPESDAAYYQLARVEVRCQCERDWLRTTEALLKNAIAINQGNAPAMGLLGDVMRRQNRTAEAEELFHRASGLPHPGPSVWVDWGNLRRQQNQIDQAINLYRRALTAPGVPDDYDETSISRARDAAYENLRDLLAMREDWGAMDDLIQQQIGESPRRPCLQATYAEFKLRRRGDIDNAIALGLRAIQNGCGDAAARQGVGLAYYTDWARKTGSDRLQSLTRARQYFPPSADLFYELARSDVTASVILQLTRAGEELDQMDEDRMSALAYAVRNQDYAAVKRLYKSGANPTLAIGEAGLPVALLPVVLLDYEGIAVFRGLGLDYSKISYRGFTALEYAKRTENVKLIEALGGAGKGT